MTKQQLAKYPDTIHLKKVGVVKDFDKNQVDKDGWTKMRLFSKGKAIYTIKRWCNVGDYVLKKQFIKKNGKLADEFSWIPLGHMIEEVEWFEHLMKGGQVTVDEDILIKS